MRTSVERLRIGLLAGAGLLVLVIAAFFGYARYKVHRALVELPGKLGATITKEFNGYTYSQSDGKKTIFTIHAAKAVQHKDGTYTLHDVNMVLYGKKGDRADHISGDDFEYDTREEVIRAVGIVHLDLEPPVSADASSKESAKHLAGASTVHEDATTGGRVIHVKTSGLVYLKKLGIAATQEGIEFAFGGFTGHAVGAEYNSESGRVVLQSAIAVSGFTQNGRDQNGIDQNAKDMGRPIALTSSHGELDRASEVAAFTNARYTSAGQVAQTELAHLHLRGDGTVERIEADRHVLLEEAGQGSVTSNHADISLDTTSKPRAAVLIGAVHFVEDEPLRQAHGDSDHANLDFDEQGHLSHALLQGSVHATERLRVARGASQQWSQRDLNSDRLELALVSTETATKPQLRDVKAMGSAQMTSAAPNAKTGAMDTTKLSGDTLAAHFVSRDGVAELSTIHGSGHTAIQQTTVTGAEQTSTGSTLDAEFRPSTKESGTVELATAMQKDGVVLTRVTPAKQSPDASAKVEVQRATAARASYDAETDQLTLTGDVRMSDAAGTVAAARVVFQRDSSDAEADGGVKVTYLQPGSAEPVHVLAARAELNHDADRATFFGNATRNGEGQGGTGPVGAGQVGAGQGGVGLARMWQPAASGQGGSQIEAPVLVFEQTQKRLTARAENTATLGTVHALLANAGCAKFLSASARPVSREMSKTGREDVTRIISSLMVYSDTGRTADFSGGVKLLGGGGEMQAQRATVYLAPASSGKTSGTAPGLTGLFGGNVERVVGTQHIEITQPGRKATGERLVYTANDGMFMLTGTAAAPPVVVDSLQGMTTGAELRFHSGDDSVVISGSDGKSPATKVHTETRVKE